MNEYVASIQASRNVEIRAKITGFIEDILVDEGMEVRKGQLLFTLNNAEYKTGVTRAEAALAQAEAEALAAELELGRTGQLVEKQIVSKTEWELAQARLRAAEAKVREARSALETARILLSYTYIRSPFNGIIDRIPFKIGSLVNEGNLLTTISDIREVYAYFAVSESQYLSYLRAQRDGRFSYYDKVSLLLADGSHFPYTGKIETMESEFDHKTGSISFRASFPNPDKILKHGASGKVLLSAPLQEAVIIPQKAVVEIQDRNFVYVLDKNNVVRMRAVEPHMRMDTSIVLRSGLHPGELIVYEGVQSLRDGSVIHPRMINADSLPSITFRFSGE